MTAKVHDILEVLSLFEKFQCSSTSLLKADAKFDQTTIYIVNVPSERRYNQRQQRRRRRQSSGAIPKSKPKPAFCWSYAGKIQRFNQLSKNPTCRSRNRF